MTSFSVHTAARLPASLVRGLLDRIGSIPVDRLGLVPPAPPVPIGTMVRRFWPFARRDRAWFLVGMVPVALLPLIQTIEIWLFQVVVDEVLTPRDPGPLPLLAAAFIGLSAAAGAISFADDVIAVRIAQRFTLAVRTAIMVHLLRLSPDRLDQRRLGDLLSRLAGDVGAIEGFLVSTPAIAVSAVVKIVLFAGAMLLIDLQLGLAALLLAPLFWGAARLFATAIRRVARERRRRSGAQLAIAEEVLSHAALVQASGREADEVARFVEEGEAVAHAALASTRLRSSLMPIVDILEVAGAIAVMWLGAVALAEGRLTLGQLLVTLTYLTQLNGPIRDIADLATSAFAASGGAERLLEVLDDRPAVRERPDAHDPGVATGRIALEHVSFGYGGGRDVLSDVTIEFEPGSVTAIVGSSGTGKSTLIKLLLRFVDPQQGRVVLDGRDLRDLTVGGVRRNVGVLLQEVLVLDRSLAENVRYARPEASDADVRAALGASEVLGFAEDLPDGEATHLAQRGRRLSGGQRQRIGIARLLVQAAPVVILDEPTASLDAATARRVMAALGTLLAGRTVIIATHDPVAMEAADRVIRIRGGRLADITGAEHRRSHVRRRARRRPTAGPAGRRVPPIATAPLAPGSRGTAGEAMGPA